MQAPKVAAGAAAAANLLGGQPLGELAAARLEALGAPRRHAQQPRGIAVELTPLGRVVHAAEQSARVWDAQHTHVLERPEQRHRFAVSQPQR